LGVNVFHWNKNVLMTATATNVAIDYQKNFAMIQKILSISYDHRNGIISLSVVLKIDLSVGHGGA
jgi:hypothetical protein